MKKRSLAIILAAGMVTAVLPGVASAGKTGDCPPGWSPVGIGAIQDEDIGNTKGTEGFFCAKFNPGREVSVVGAPIDIGL